MYTVYVLERTVGQASHNISVYFLTVIAATENYCYSYASTLLLQLPTARSRDISYKALQ